MILRSIFKRKVINFFYNYLKRKHSSNKSFKDLLLRSQVDKFLKSEVKPQCLDNDIREFLPSKPTEYNMRS